MKICYIISHGTAEWVDIKESKDNILHIQFTPSCTGAITLRDRIFEVKDGSVAIPLNILPSGEYRPKLEADTGVFFAEGFYKVGDMITMLNTDDAVIRRLVRRCHALEKTCVSLEGKVAHLEAMCQGHKIFDYERMEK